MADNYLQQLTAASSILASYLIPISDDPASTGRLKKATFTQLIAFINTQSIIAAAGTLTGTTLASNVVTSSLTSVGTLTGLTVSSDATINGVSIGSVGVGNLTRVGNGAGVDGLRGTYVGSGAGALATSEDNSLFGHQAGQGLNGSASKNTILGSRADSITGTGSDSIVIGYNAVGDGSNTTVIGNSSTTNTHLFGTLKAGNVTITNPATVATLTISNNKTVTFSNTLTFAGTDSSTLNIGTGGTLGTAAYTAASAYEVPLTFSTGLTRTTNTITVNTSQNIATLSNLTGNGIVTTSGGVGTLSVTGTIGTGSVVLSTSPTFTTSIIDPLVIGGTSTTSTLTLRSTSGVGTSSADIIFQVGNNGATEAMRILNSANVGIGISPTQRLSVYKLSTGITTGEIGVLSELDITMSGDGNTNITPFSTTLRFRGSTNQTDSTKGASGLLLSAFCYNTAIVTNFSGWRCDLRNLSTGTITNAQAIWITSILNSGGGAITNAAGIRISDITTGTNNYGISLGISSGANKYNVYSSGTALNYFNGTILFGTTTLPTSATYNIVLGGGSTSPVLGAATEDIVTMSPVDKAAGDRRWYLQTELGSSISLGNDRFNFAATTGIVSIGGTDIISMTSTNYTLTGNMKLGTAGNGLYVKEGTNATMGRSVLVAGTVIVSTTKASTTMEVLLTNRIAGGVLGILSVGTVVAGTSFVINSSNVADTSTVNWLIVEPA